jgi:predicted metal-dependent phosphoesterase TrpH
MGAADLHIHTTYSWDGTCTIQAALKQASHEMGLDVIAITDHDEIEGALRARDIAWKYNMEVVVGSEVSSLDGHLLCLYIQHKIPAGLPLEETVQMVREQGGLCIAAHPAARAVPSLKADRLAQALAHKDVGDTLVGIEAFNAGLVFQSDNERALRLADEFGLSATGNSDAHLVWMIGMGATAFAGSTAADLRQALIHRQTAVYSAGAISPVHCIGSWMLRYSLRKLGWVTNNPAPQFPLMTMRTAKAI